MQTLLTCSISYTSGTKGTKGSHVKEKRKKRDSLHPLGDPLTQESVSPGRNLRKQNVIHVRMQEAAELEAGGKS